MHQQADDVLVEHSKGTSRADLVVLADGLASATRHHITGPAPQPRYAGYTAWRGVTEPDTGLPTRLAAAESWGRGQRFGIVPLPSGRAYWFATANTAEGRHTPGGEHTGLLRRFAGWHEPITRVLEATESDQVLRHDVYDLHPHPSSYVRGRLVLLGDAAHAMTPNLGQGACQALEDAATLGVLAGRGSDLAAALASYDALRRPRAQLIARRSRQLGRVGQLDGWAATLIRDLLVRATPSRVTDRQLHATLAWQPPPAAVA